MIGVRKPSTIKYIILPLRCLVNICNNMPNASLKTVLKKTHYEKEFGEGKKSTIIVYTPHNIALLVLNASNYLIKILLEKPSETKP